MHLLAAKKFGDELVVSVTRNKYVNKGPNRPAFDEQERATVLKHWDFIDRVILVRSSLEALMRIKPDVFAKGKEYEGKIKPMDEEYCRQNGIEIAFTDEIVY